VTGSKTGSKTDSKTGSSNSETFQPPVESSSSPKSGGITGSNTGSKPGEKCQLFADIHLGIRSSNAFKLRSPLDSTFFGPPLLGRHQQRHQHRDCQLIIKSLQTREPLLRV
jgi:hypothetical protein